MNFPEKLKDLRTAHGYTQVQMAKLISVSYRQYQNLEYGKNNPNLNNLIALADFFKITLDDLVGRVPPKS